MRLRTRITALILSLTALISVSALVVTSVFLNNVLTDQAIRQLQSLADAKLSEVEAILSFYDERASSLANRIATVESSPDSSALTPEVVGPILADERIAFSDIEWAAVFDPSSELVDSTRAFEQRELDIVGNMLATIGESHAQYDRRIATVVVLRPIVSSTRIGLGRVAIAIDPINITASVQNYAGLGATGEILIATRDGFGDAEFIHTRRFEDATGATAVVDKEALEVPVTQALLGNEGLFLDGLDYRGEPVFAATRYIDSADMGIVVKIDRAEILDRAQSVRTISIIASVVTITLISLFAFLTARSISTPIEQLTALTKKILKKSFVIDKQPGLLRRNDEIGTLSTSFLEMAERVQNYYQDLEREVQEKTHELRQQVTETKKFQLAADSSTDAVIMVDPNHKIMYWNEASKNVFGHTSNDMLGKRVDLLIDKETSQEARQAFSKAFQSKEVFTTEDIVVRRSDGVNIKVQLSIYPIKDEEQVYIFVLLAQDITLRKSVDQAKTEFVSLASHQLKTPLTAMGWLAELLLDGTAGRLTKDQREHVENIHYSNKQMIALVNALLNVSRLELGTFMINPSLTDIDALTKDILIELKPQITRKKLRVDKDIDARLPKVNVDPELMRIILQNLLSNAVKYTPASRNISIRVAPLAAGKKFGGKTLERDSITIKVQDSGIGIPLAQQRKIFSKLFRADNARAGEAEGTGLGLYIVKSILDASNGLVWFESKEGTGSTFYVTLPKEGMKPKSGTKKLA